MKLSEREEQIYEDGIKYGQKESLNEIMKLKAKIVELKEFIDKLFSPGKQQGGAK